ncbi:MAG: SirB2 family protein [Lysobacteraceae bacterium]
MIEFYPQIRFVHIACVVLSGMLFFLRGTGVLAGARWPMRLPVRLASYSIDTVLLTAALMLVTMLPGAMFANGWLTTKLVLLVVYVILGSFALKRARTPRAMRLCFVAAAATYLFMFSIARAHDPAGILRAILN